MSDRTLTSKGERVLTTDDAGIQREWDSETFAYVRTPQNPNTHPSFQAGR
jgi:hypothetical protein